VKAMTALGIHNSTDNLLAAPQRSEGGRGSKRLNRS